MKKSNLTTALFAAIMLTGVVGCASTDKREGTAEYVDDSWITTKVKSAIVAEPTLKSSEINVETFKGTVQLSGFVTQKEDIAKAGSVARDIKGVSSVKNDLRQKKDGPGNYADDAMITGKVKSAIVAESSLKASEINVETSKGVVQLSGFVRQKDDIAKAASVARGVNGVTSVKNDLRLK